SILAVLAAVLPPLPAVGSALDSLQADPVIARIAVWGGPDADEVAGVQCALGDAVVLELRGTGPFDVIGFRLAEGVATHDVDPRVRVLVLELDNVALDFDGVLLDVVRGERVVSQHRTSDDRGAPESERKAPSHHDASNAAHSVSAQARLHPPPSSAQAFALPREPSGFNRIIART